MRTLKILGLLLTYPVPETVSHWPEMSAILAGEKILPKKQLQKIQGFIEQKYSEDIYRVQEDYVQTFDRGRGNSLHLFEHIHGESRERGLAMVDLTEMYQQVGLAIDQAELPDYLPMFLEYCSMREYPEAKSLLGEIAHVVANVGEKLKKRENPYHVIFDSLVVLSEKKVDPKIIAEAAAFVEADDDSLEALDREWEEAEAFSGDPKTDDCHSCVPGTDPNNSPGSTPTSSAGDAQPVNILGGVK